MHADGVDAIGDQWRAERPDLGELLPMELFGRVYRIAAAMGERVERVYQPFGISRAEFDVLATLRRSGEPFTLSPKQLSDTLMLTTGGMTGRLDRLERAGLVERQPHPDDRRSLRVRLTPSGKDTVDRAVAAGLELQREILAKLPPADARRLAELLRDLLAAVR
ncbi:MarR family transcriptional regulator [Catellatospora sp. TT07R-123]|uniref:MarR family winged helix-turn-helix transcriptional regulator n=1 Tax=Catellatospora sp. TT07R-123 TaxID=2733863 RepID=UPI001B2CA3EB|nr:MarR family transcriptional regulator [Catellatospora sp. TT07R-123]GHJ43945.1 MarR family transcriptional regulator [Catellatospora sp. TT07R-123]